MANAQAQDRRNNNQAPAIITELQPSRLPVSADVLRTMGVSEGEWRVLVDQLYPAAKSAEAVQLVLTYCKSRGLDPMKKPCHIVPVYSSLQKRMVETVWPGISELRTTATRTGAYAGITEAEFGPTVICEFTQKLEDDRDPRAAPRTIKHTVTYPEWCRMTAYRMVQGVKCAFQARVFWTELCATAGRNTDMPNEMWRKRPFGQIEKCCEAAALRKAFPEELGNEYSAEEMTGRVIDDATIPTAPIPETKTPQAAPRPPRTTDGSAERRSSPTGDNNQDRKATPPRTDGGRRSERVKPDDGKVIDGEVIPPGKTETADDAADPNEAFFAKLEADLLAANDESDFEEIWDKADALAKFDGDEPLQRRALEIRRKVFSELAGG